LIGDRLVGKDRNINTVLSFIRPLLGDRTLISINDSTPFITNDHPVYCQDGIWKSYNPEATKAKYVALRDLNIGKLSIGDVIDTLDGSGLKVESLVEHNDDPSLQVYNFTLDGNNTYIADNLVVHNKGGGGGAGGAGGGGGCVPLAQTFKVNSVSGSDGVFLTSMKLWFRDKDANQPITISIRDTVVGFPGNIIIAEQIVENEDIFVSDDASLATTITFSTPIYLRTGIDYSYVIVPGNQSPDFTCWTAETGIPDITTPALYATKNWGLGVMFLSTNDTVYTPYQSEDIKFEMKIASFTKTNGQIVLHNDNYEFLTLSGVEGAFLTNEEVAQKSNTYLTGSFTGNTTSTTVNTSVNQVTSLSTGDYVLITYANTAVAKTGTVSANTTSAQVNGASTSFTSEYAVGDYLLINGNVRSIDTISNNTIMILDAPLSNTVSAVAHSGVTERFQISRVNSVTSSNITLKDRLDYIIDGGTTFHGAIQKVVRATVEVLDDNNTIILKNSTAANSSFLFQSGKKIIGENSQSSATVASVNDKTINFVESYLRYIIPSSTSLSLVSRIDGATANAANNFLRDGVTNPLDYVGEIKSRSNEIVSGSKSLTVYADLTRSGTQQYVSPFIDISPASVVIKENLINNDSTNETTGYGNSSVRYISKNVVLAEGLDAEDIKVYITAYKPPQSDILVYTKIISSDDGDSLSDKDWTLLEQVTESNLYSDSFNEANYIEYEYSFRQTPPYSAIDGIITSSTNTTITGIGTAFSSSLVANDVVKIVQTSSLTGYDIAIVDSVANNTTLTLKANTSFTGSGSIEKVTQKNAAFKYNRESNTVTYFDSTLGRHSSYKIFAIKVVLLSSSSKYVPVMRDVRAIAVSI